jgi:hypothetical protein
MAGSADLTVIGDSVGPTFIVRVWREFPERKVFHFTGV